MSIGKLQLFLTHDAADDIDVVKQPHRLK